MATADQYAQWIVDNANKKGTADFDTVVQAYNEAKQQEEASKPKTAMLPPVEGSGGAAFGVYRPAGRRPESQQDRAASAEMPLQTLRGVASNVTAPLGLPGEIVNQVVNAPRTVQDIANRYQSVKSQLAGNEPQPLPELPPRQQVMPGMEWSNSLIPGPEPSSPAGRLAFGAGQIAGAPVGPATVGMGLRAAGTTIKGAGDVAGGMLGRASGYIAKPGETPTGYQIPSARIPLGNEYITPENWSAFEQGQMPYGEFPPTTPINQLPTNRLEKAALMASGGEIPGAGQGLRAFGERLGETYRNPVTAAVDIGTAALTGIPLYTAGKAAVAGTQGLADYMLARKGFDPALQAKLDAYKSGQMPMPGTPPTGPAGGPPGGAGIPPTTPPVSGPPSAANYMPRMEQLSQQVLPKTTPAATAPTPAQVNLRQQLNAPQNAPPNTMSMMTNEAMPNIGTKYEGTPNYQYHPDWHGHMHGIETPLTPEEATTWRTQHSLTGEPYNIKTTDPITGVEKEVVGNSKYGDTVLGVMMDIDGKYTQYRLHSDGTYTKAYPNAKGKLISKEYTTVPKDFPEEFPR